MRGVTEGAASTLLLKRLVLVTFLASLLVSNAYALDTNLSVNTYIIHSEPYTPYQIFIVTLALGLTFLILALLLSKEQNSDAFGALSIIPLFAAAWMALQIDIPVSGMISMANDTNMIRTEHHIYPATILAVIIFLLALIAIFQTYRLLTSDTSIAERTQGRSAYAGDDAEEPPY